MPINLANVIVELEGVDADGAPPTAKPVLVAGQDGTDVQTLKTNATGQLEVAVVAGGGTGGLTDAELRATPVPVSAATLPLPTGAATAANQQTDALTDTELRASAVPVSAAALPLPTGAATAALQQNDALTDTELRATPVPVSGTVATTGGLTDAELRATPVPVSGTVATTGGLTDAELRASAVPVDGSGVTQPVSAAALPLPTGAATAALQQNDALTDTELRATPVPVSGTVATGGLTDAQLRATEVPVVDNDVATNTAAAAASLATLDNIVAGSEAQVDVVAALPAGTNNIGAIRTYGVSGRMIDSDDGTTVIPVKTVNGIATASGDNVVLAAVTGKKIRVLSYALQVQEAGTVTARFQDNATATNRTMPWFLVAGATQYDGVVRNPGGDGHFYFETDAGVGLDLNLSGATDVAYELSYVEVD